MLVVYDTLILDCVGAGSAMLLSDSNDARRELVVGELFLCSLVPWQFETWLFNS
jgi:hypothetical protein